MLDGVLSTIVAIFGTFGISFVIEKSPIKFNPLSLIKKFLVGDIIEKTNDINKKVDNIKLNVDENEKDRIRETILSYKKSMDNGITLSEHEYEYVLKIFDKYKNELHGNSFICDVIEEIKDLYKKQLQK